MWTYSQGTGNLLDPSGKLVATGYSGHGHGKNNCDLQHVPNVGPIPRGYWILGKPYDSKKVGPYAIPLKPVLETETFGRSAFLCHGESSKNPGNASEGCIIFKRNVRNMMWDSGDRLLLVVS